MTCPPAVNPSDIWVAIRADGYAGCGTPANPYDGSTPAVFDNLMNSFAANTTIHLGPGIFQTRGASTGPIAWSPKSGQKIIGAGLDATVLKLVDASSAGQGYAAIGTGSFLDGFEASDFTVDCNLGGQPVTDAAKGFPTVACGAISLRGRHIRLRRIRAINFGTLAAGRECFVVFPMFADPNQPETVDCVIEDCIIEKPCINNGAQVSCIVLGGTEDQSTGQKAYHRACVIRNCLVNCEYSDNPVGISGITYSGTTATVTTKSPHNRAPGQWVVVSGALENGVPSTNYNGSFQITAVPSATQFQYTMPGTPSAQPTGEIYIGKFSSHFIPIQQLSIDSQTLIVMLTSVTPHDRVLGGTVNVLNVLVNNNLVNDFNGAFQITAIISPTVLQYKMTTNPGTPDYSIAFIGTAFQALSADGGIGAVAEGNRIYNCRIGGPYHDTYSTKDMVVRNNYYYSVAAGPYQNMGFTSMPRSATSLTRGGPDNKTATFTTQAAHGLAVGEPVVIAGAKVGGVSSDYYNGTFAIDSVPNPVQFTYRMTQAPTADADASPAPTYGALWQARRLLIENNIVELIASVSGWGSPIAIPLYDNLSGAHGSQFIFQQVIIRGNIIRHVDNASDSTQRPLGIYLDSCQNAIVQGNIINLDSPISIQHYLVGSVKYFNNQSNEGKPIQGYSYPAPQRYVNDLTIDADLGAALST